MDNFRSHIIKGDLVEYIDAKNARIDGKLKTIYVPIYGIWDGEKVVCDDNEKTTVRKKDWLELIFPSL